MGGPVIELVIMLYFTVYSKLLNYLYTTLLPQSVFQFNLIFLAGFRICVAMYTIHSFGRKQRVGPLIEVN